jgi:acyl dehydratase
MGPGGEGGEHFHVTHYHVTRAGSMTGLQTGWAMTKYLEDFREGETWHSGPVVIGEEDIVAFARMYDPQPIHVDPDAAGNGPFGGLIASGWQVAALSMKLFVEAGGHGGAPIVGIGVDELRWKQAVRPGDSLRSIREIVEVRRSASKPDRGVIRSRVTVLNQRDETVMTYYALGQVRARSCP